MGDTQKYVKAILGARGKESCVDDVYGIYLHKDGLIGNKPSNVNEVDNIIIVDIRYAGTCGLYEFSREFPTISFTRKTSTSTRACWTNAHKHKHHSQDRVLGNRRYKDKHVIAPLMSVTFKKQKKSGKELFHAMTLNDSAIDYVH